MDWDYKTNGHYFFDDSERGDPTCDIEFQKGSVTDESHRKDSGRFESPLHYYR